MAGIKITGLAELRERLRGAHVAEVMARTLAAEAERLAQAVRDELDTPPGAGAHDRPWTRTGALRDSIQSTADGLEAAVGSNDPAAAPQELGTAHIPPRPFFGPAAAGISTEIAGSIAEAVAAALRGRSGRP